MKFVRPWYQLGYVIPHLYTDIDAYQFYRVAPDGMMLVTTQLNLQEYSQAAVEAELPTLQQRLEVLAGKRVDRIVIAGVPVAASLGRARTLALLAEAQERSGIPCDNDFEAHVAALRHLGVERLALATRWPDALNDAVIAYLNDVGVEVVACVAQRRNLEQNKRAVAGDDHDLALELGRRALRQAPQAQALLLPGGLWFAIHAAAQLEEEFAVPVLLNITSAVWAALHAAPRPLPASPDPRWGRLLAGLADA